MADKDMWRAPDLVPSITYADVPRAVEWLERVFGFHDRAEARLSWPGGGMAWIEAGESLFNVASPDETWPQAPSAVGPDLVMKVYVDDVDRHFTRAGRGSQNHIRTERRILEWADLPGA